MALQRVPGAELYYQDTRGDGPPLVFSHGLLWSGRMFEAQIARLRDRYRCIAYDHRGQGRSAPARERSISMETCYADAVAFIEALKLGPCHFVGLSMGGFVGIRLAARRPDLVRRLVLVESTADPEPPSNVPRYRLLTLVAGTLGVRPVVAPVMKIMFGASMRSDPARRAELHRWRDQLLENRRDIVRAVRGVIERDGVHHELPLIRAPTLVLVGEEDTATVPAKAERMVAAIPGAELIRIPRAGHTSSVEAPEQVSDAIEAFLARDDAASPAS